MTLDKECKSWENMQGMPVPLWEQMLKISYGFSQYLQPSLVPLVPVLLQPFESHSQLGFEKLSSNEQLG